MIRTITMTFEADEAALAKATAALFEVTPFGRCIEIAAGDNPMCEAQRPDEPRYAKRNQGRAMTYDHWKTTEPDDGAEPPCEKPMFTEADMAAAVEAEREACEQIARAGFGWQGSSGVVSRIIAGIVERKKRDAR